MRVLAVITRGDTFGGAQSHVRDLAVGLTGAGHTVQVVTGSAGPLTEALAAAGVPVILCPEILREIQPLRDVRAVARLREIIRAFAPDLVCTHSSKAGIVGRIATRLSGVPALFTAHGWAFTEGVAQPRRTIYRTLERMVAPLAAKIICVSEYDRRLAIAGGLSPDRLLTIHNGMPDVPPFLRARPESFDPVRIVMVARFAVPKDHRTLIDAVRGLAGVQLDLVGDGPGLEATRRYVRESGQREQVIFHGRRDDVPAVLTQAQIFALSSNYEGFPLSTLEAMRAGLPVIVSNVGGAPEAVVDGVTGYLAPRGDVAAWRNRIALLAGDPARRAAMGLAARRRYEAEFTFDRMFARTLDTYDAVLGTRSRRQGEVARGVDPRVA